MSRLHFMSTRETPPRTEECELCIVGAGYAALNGLNAAAKYLKKGDRVVVIDRMETWGGQWVPQYDFVRLHQPYRMFTAGDQRWTLERDPAHLATRREILDHLSTVPAVSAGHLEVRALFGHDYTGHHIRGARVEVDAVPVAGAEASAGPVRIRARRLLKGTGLKIEMLKAFPLSSTRVRSVPMTDPVLTTPEFLRSPAPVFVIGSGKTGMDCVRHVLAGSEARRPIHAIPGSGMWFFVRDNFYPRGYRRFGQGTLMADGFMRICSLFEGENEAQIAQSLERDGLFMNVFGQGGNFRFGVQSIAERDEVRAGVTQVHWGHLVDVEGTRMTLRTGAELHEVAVPEGSWFVNCTSHLRHFPHEPVLQDSGLVCSPQFSMGFTGTSAYYLTHLWYRDALATVAAELFRTRLDIEPKLRFMPEFSLMVLANIALAGPHLPLSIHSRFQGDLNKWYPSYRQLPTLARILKTRNGMIRKAERLLKQRWSDAPDPS